MTASYPGAIWAPTTKLGWRHILWAEHMNRLQEEIDAMQRTFGTNPHISWENPGGVIRNYGTVEQRATAHARGIDLPFYRGRAANMSMTPNAWTPVVFNPSADASHLGASNGTSITLNETGRWLIHARAEYKSTGYTLSRNARRMLRILINGQPVGLDDYTREEAKNAFALHCHVSWHENWEAGTEISVQVRTDVESPDHTLLANVVLRADLLRTTEGVTDGQVHAIDLGA